MIDGTEYHMYSTVLQYRFVSCMQRRYIPQAYASFYCTCIFLLSQHHMPATVYTMNSWAVCAEIEKGMGVILPARIPAQVAYKAGFSHEISSRILLAVIIIISSDKVR